MCTAYLQRVVGIYVLAAAAFFTFQVLWSWRYLLEKDFPESVFTLPIDTGKWISVRRRHVSYCHAVFFQVALSAKQSGDDAHKLCALGHSRRVEHVLRIGSALASHYHRTSPSRCDEGSNRHATSAISNGKLSYHEKASRETCVSF